MRHKSGEWEVAPEAALHFFEYFLLRPDGVITLLHVVGCPGCGEGSEVTSATWAPVIWAN
jgi:hypothetical protein